MKKIIFRFMSFLVGLLVILSPCRSYGKDGEGQKTGGDVPGVHYYLNVGGGDELVFTGYAGRDARPFIQIEGGGQWFAIPATISFGQDMVIVGVKPRVQYLFAPSKNLPGLFLIPGLGLVMNIWFQGSANTSKTNAEIGVQVSGHIQYYITQQFNVMFTPICVDTNFLRTMAEGKYFGGDIETKSAGGLYSIALSAGFLF